MRTFLGVLGAMATIIPAVAASAAVYVPGSPQFQISTVPGTTVFNSPTISGTIQVTTSAPGTFSDDFQFTIPQMGIGSGSVITSASMTTSTNFLNILSVTFDGVVVPGSYNSSTQLFQYAALTAVPISAFQQNDLVIKYSTNGTGSYGGNLTFDVTPVPEPVTWLTFLAGFGIIGLGLRQRQNSPKRFLTGN